MNTRQPLPIPTLAGTDPEQIRKLEHRNAELAAALETEKESGRKKTRFVSMASHEFRSPLSRIQLSAALIERYYERLDGEKVIGHAVKIRNAVADMTIILNELLSVEKIESGNMTVACKEMDLNMLCAEVIEEMGSLTQPGQRLVYQPGTAPLIVKLDRALLKQCLLNLLSNAIKYAGEGDIILTARLQNSECRITVQDHGCGISAADQEHLFEAFYRAEKTIDVPGTGLGLHIVQQYVQLMGGNIELKSKPGSGSGFTLIFQTWR